MTELINCVIIVLIPLILTSILHLIVIKLNLFQFINTPIHSKLFGNNKTCRGFIFVCITNSFILFLFNQLFNLHLDLSLFIGFALGFNYVLFELPNSFFKRRAGIKPGESHLNKQYIFLILDKTDSAFGVTLTYYFLSSISFNMALALFITNSLFHVIMAFLLVKIKLKSSF